MQYVLDAASLIAFLRDEDGAKIVENLLINDVCITHH
jgi:PIN domain nuclease of toxin-antitoxin system